MNDQATPENIMKLNRILDSLTIEQIKQICKEGGIDPEIFLAYKVMTVPQDNKR